MIIKTIEIEIDTEQNREFLKCEYNRDGDSYRSPWSNKYFPLQSDDALYPSADLLAMEQKANEVFARYATMYFDTTAITSVYLFDIAEVDGFGACFLVKKGTTICLT